MSSDEKKIQDLERAVILADALSQQKSNFLATMSHEIRTPMQTIYGLLELISLKDTADDVTNMVTTAQDAASNLLEILDDILDIAKMDADAMELDVYEVPVRLLVYGIIEALTVRKRGSNVSLEAQIETDVPFVILGDPQRLRQILINLCSNALKFTHEGSVVIRVTTSQKDNLKEGQITLRFEVIDTGIGMNEHVVSDLFMPFTQVDNSTARKYGGTGLGLSISKKLVDLMNGKIGASSEEGKGSTFWFEIPTEEIFTDEERIELPNLEGISVLSVEDHPQGAQEIKNSLQSMGAIVDSCASYEEGLTRIAQRPFDVAIIDQGLPDGLGLDLLRECTQIQPAMGLVMYTVRDDIGLSHSLHSLGALYLTKPASRKGLGEAVKRVARQVNYTVKEKPRILLVEDTESVRYILQQQFEQLNLRVEYAEHATQALSMIKEKSYDLVITDLHMPQMDGYELVKTIRKNQEKQNIYFPVVVLSADVQITHKDNYITHGFDEYLLKPVTLGQLRGLLMRWQLLGMSKTPDVESQPKQEKHNPQIVDRNCLISNIGAIDENTYQMMVMFVEMTEPLIQKISLAYDDPNYDVLYELAHSLKGAAQSACCTKLGDLAEALENRCKKKQDITGYDNKISAAFEDVKTEIPKLRIESH